MNSTSFKSISKCNFEQRVNLCNKTNYHIKDVFDRNDFYIVSVKLKTAFKVLLYPISLFGLITNFFVTLVLLKKDNSDLFKGLKHYSYLCLNSILCIMIAVIELISWMSECFYPFEVFCPEIRKLVAIQFFKIIFKECLVTLFRFMCNFTYVAFALNRIGLIGKDHGKVVTSMSEVGIKKYIVITFIISCIFSWIKGFKYQVNYFYPYMNYPISNELYIVETIMSPNFDNFFFIYNSISDLINYLVFVVICAIIDVSMVVQLRRVLVEKTNKSESMNQKLNEAKKAENDEVLNTAIKMVVLNSLIGIFFKLPLVFIPIINTYAVFYYKDSYYQYFHPYFGEFFILLYDSGAYYLIQDVSYLLYNISLSIQVFIYNRFDKKFRTAFGRLKDKVFSFIENIF